MVDAVQNIENSQQKTEDSQQSKGMKKMNINELQKTEIVLKEIRILDAQSKMMDELFKEELQ